MKNKLLIHLSTSFILLLCLANFSIVFAEDNIEYRFERTWPKLEESWDFDSPSDLALAPDGSVYILGSNSFYSSDSGAEPIRHYSAEGEYIRTLGDFGLGEGQLINPVAITIAPDGSIYIADIDNINHRVLKFSPQGHYIQTFLTSFGDDNTLVSIAIAPDSNLYLLQQDQFTGSSNILKYSFQDGFSEFWGDFDGLGVDIILTDLAIAPDGNVYVTDLYNSRILQFNPQGDFIQTWGGSGNGQFTSLKNIAIAPDGSVYVYDGRIQKFTAQGEFIQVWGSQGTADNQFFEVTDLEITRDGSIYIADQSKNRIQQFSEQGDYIQTWGNQNQKKGKFQEPTSVGIASNNNIYVADSENNRIQQFNTQGEFIRSWGRKGSGIGQFNLPNNLAIAPDNSVYIADTNNHRVQQFSAQGQYIRSWGDEGSGEIFKPEIIAIAPDSSVYVTDHNSERIQKFSAEGIYIADLIRKGGSSNSPAKNMAIAPDGSIYIAYLNNSIEQFSAQGDFIRTLGSEGSGNGQFKSPDGITITPDGNIYIADTNNHRIQQFNAQGDFIRTFGSKGSGTGQFSNPQDIAIGSDGAVYVADTGNNRIQKFTPRKKGATPFPQKAILLAGGGPSKGSYKNLIWNETRLLANKAHQAISSQGFEKDEVKYLTAGSTDSDVDGNKLNDDLETATLHSLQQAITIWAANATDVLIYLIDHGGPGKFEINDHEVLTSAQLSTWVNQLDDIIPGKVTVIIESCQSGSFLPALAKQKRNLIASTNANQPAIISNKGLNSFSYYFWSEISAGATLQEAFKTGRQGMSPQFVEGQAQSAQLDSNGDTLFNASDYGDLANFCIGNCTKYYSSSQTEYVSDAPVILSVTESLTLEGTTSAELTMQINNRENITQAWVTIIPPDFRHQKTDEPVSELNKIPLKCDANQRCTTEYQGFDKPGDYQATFYAQNINFQMAIPKSIIITQSDGLDDDSKKPGDTSAPSSFITAIYDDQTKTVFINDVLYETDHYQAELIHPGDYTFSLKSAIQLESPLLQVPNTFDLASSKLLLHKVSAFDKYYKVILKHLGDFVFQLESAEEIPK
ncbi:MAG: 6-bladed beta-propeller [Methylococcaceae bacterium]